MLATQLHSAVRLEKMQIILQRIFLVTDGDRLADYSFKSACLDGSYYN